MGTRPVVDGRAWLVLWASVVIVFLTLGLRHSFGLFLGPLTTEFGISRSAFGLAIALQGLFWGLAQPIAGIVADKFGPALVIFVGAVLYASGLGLAAFSATPLLLCMSLGVLVGLGLSATSFAVVLGAVGRRFPAEGRSKALGIASAGGSVGMFASVPLAVGLIDRLGGVDALLVMAAIVSIACLLSVGLAGKAKIEQSAGQDQSLAGALREASSHGGYLLLILGFFVCGFQLAFIGTHLPSYLLDNALPSWLGGSALAVVGIANAVGTLGWGMLGDRWSKKNLLTILYLLRAAMTVGFLYAPLGIHSVMAYAVGMGLTWLGTVPLTSSIVAQIFGPRYLSTLIGIVFLMHQVGAFLGAWLGGYVFDTTGSYDPVWWSVVAFGLMAALLHWPIDERPIQRLSHAAV